MNKRFTVLFILAVFLGMPCLAQEDGKNRQNKGEQATFEIPLQDGLKEEQVKKLEEAFKSFGAGQVSGVQKESKQITVTTKSAVHLTELEKIFKDAEVSVSKDEMILKGKVNLRVKVQFQGGG